MSGDTVLDRATEALYHHWERNGPELAAAVLAALDIPLDCPAGLVSKALGMASFYLRSLPGPGYQAVTDFYDLDPVSAAWLLQWDGGSHV